MQECGHTWNDKEEGDGFKNVSHRVPRATPPWDRLGHREHGGGAGRRPSVALCSPSVFLCALRVKLSPQWPGRGLFDAHASPGQNRRRAW